MSTLPYRDRVAHLFRSYPNTWIDGNELALVGGCYAWRSRVSDCRLALGMKIENRQRKVGKRTISEYRYRPADLFEAAGVNA
jgi:hypothetical protein